MGWVIPCFGLGANYGQAGRRQGVLWSSKTLIGSTLMGAGFFNLTEGLIDHEILGIYHVKPGQNQLAWDLGFLVLGMVLVVVGWVIIIRERID